jgi:aspartate/methionine/tyrosine aminotransferase
MRRFPASEIISLVGAAPRYDLAESVGPDVALAELIDAAGFTKIQLGYGTAAGDPRLRKAIAEANGVTADEVVVTIGGMHALFLLAFILCGRDAEAVITAPAFPPARDCLKAVGATVKELPLSFKRGYQPDLAHLRELLSPRTKLVSLASPQNPSGVAIRVNALREILRAMGEICPEAYLLVDETYREAAYGDDAVAPSALALGPRVVSVASLSKCHGAPGLRLGWAITSDAELQQQLVLGKFNTVISCSPVNEAMALRVLCASKRILDQRRQRLAEGLARTATWVAANSALIEWVRPDAGALCCVRLKSEVFDDAAVGEFYAALPEKNVRIANGTWFGEEANVFRLGFGLLAPADLEAGLAALTAALRQAVRVEIAALQAVQCAGASVCGRQS